MNDIDPEFFRKLADMYVLIPEMGLSEKESEAIKAFAVFVDKTLNKKDENKND